MTITEQFICGKHTAADCEDGIVITPHFAAVIDGSTPIYMPGTRIITVAHSVVLASDGYPTLLPTLRESEEALAKHLATDPQNITDFVATKGLVEGNASFDDRAYVSLNI